MHPSTGSSMLDAARLELGIENYTLSQVKRSTGHTHTHTHTHTHRQRTTPPTPTRT